MSATSDLKTRDGSLVNHWYIACLSEELGRNKPIQRVLYDTPLALYRTPEGRPVCLTDRCLHRSAELSEGRICGNNLACPYHGWAYSPEGKVVSIPSEKPGQPCSLSGARIRSFPVVEQDRAIWVWMGAGPPQVPAPPFRFPFLDEPGTCSYFMITDFDNEVTHLAENFMDVPHTVFVHKGWFRSISTKKVPIRVETGEGSVLVTYEQPADEIGFTGRILNPRNEPMIHTDRFILPNITRVDYLFGSSRKFVIISQCSPVSTLKTRVYTAIIYRMGLPTFPLKPFFRFYTRKVIQQDVEIMAIQGRSFQRDFRCNFVSVDADIVHSAIEKLRDLAIKGEASAFTMKKTEEREIWI